MKYKIILTLALLLSFSVNAFEGNTSIQSFNQAKKILNKQIYNQLPRTTIYCGASFNDKKLVTDPAGFSSTKYKKRAKKIEWEHVVPAENFGRTFVEWREGHPACVDRKGKSFKGRNCASKINKEYRYMQADLYNLYPAIGAVNALRSNYRFAALNDPALQLGNCEMMIDSNERRAEPPDRAKGIVARVSLYFDQVYPRFKLSQAQRKLFEVWDKQFPVTEIECRRNRIIESIQGGVNGVLRGRC